MHTFAKESGWTVAGGFARTPAELPEWAVGQACAAHVRFPAIVRVMARPAEVCGGGNTYPIGIRGRCLVATPSLGATVNASFAADRNTLVVDAPAGGAIIVYGTRFHEAPVAGLTWCTHVRTCLLGSGSVRGDFFCWSEVLDSDVLGLPQIIGSVSKGHVGRHITEHCCLCTSREECHHQAANRTADSSSHFPPRLSSSIASITTSSTEKVQCGGAVIFASSPTRQDRRTRRGRAVGILPSAGSHWQRGLSPQRRSKGR